MQIWNALGDKLPFASW